MGILNWLYKKDKTAVEAEARASLENPNTLLSDPAAWLVDWMGGGSTDSGVAVTEKSAMKFSAVFACVRVIAETIASLPLITYKSVEEGKVKTKTHPVYRLLKDQPNSEMTAFTFRELMMTHVLLWGNSYAFIERNNAARPTALFPLMPDRTWAERRDGVLTYLTTVNGERIRLKPEDVLHIPGLGFDGITGLSTIQVARQSVGLALAAEEFGARFFGNGANIGGVLEAPGKVSPEAANNLKTSWSKAHSGLKNSHKVAVLEEGLKWTKTGMANKDAQYIDTRKFQVNEIARIFRVPPHMIGDLERATFSNVEQQAIDFVVHTIRPWLVRSEQEYNRKLFRESEKGRVFAEHKLDGLLRGDVATRTAAYATARQNGWLSANEIREMENMNKIEGGDEFMVPLNMTPVNGEPEPEPTPDPEENSVRDSFKRLFMDAHRRIANREVSEIRKARKKYKGANLDKWAEDFFDEYRGVVEVALGPVVQSFAEATRSEIPDLKEISNKYINESLRRFKAGGGLHEWESKRPEQEALYLGGYQ